MIQNNDYCVKDTLSDIYFQGDVKVDEGIEYFATRIHRTNH